ncbi:Uncharacterised protein [Mycobacteroides abscessus subsp. abscessus]|nr:Uncharacterised protein [Mycobacteroides abscessus subsp. abscessus]
MGGESVEDFDGHPVVVLGVREVLGGEPGLRTANRGVAHQNRLEVGLRDIHRQAWRSELVVGLPVGTGAPGADSADLLAGD